ncbi:MAG: heavy metal translocating P-type ATPase [Lachnospiraceae bacterium]|nr:heavy metal translocating P-type ATPase [Lachnospiraceae bacterium]
MEQFVVTGMSCAACQTRVEKAVSKVPGVTSCSVSLLTNSMGVEGTASEEAIIQAVENAGYGASKKGEEISAKQSASQRLAEEEDALKDRETPKLKKRLKYSVIFLVLLMYITMGHNMWNWPLPSFLVHNHLGLALTQMLLALVVMFINRKFFTSGFRSLIEGAPNMDTLVALGSSVSFGWSLAVFYQMTIAVTNGVSNMDLMPMYHNELYFESAAMIPALITVGKMLEAMSKGRTTDALKSLMKLAPKTANVIRNGKEETVGIDEVQTGDIFVVRPGESIPVDGVIEEGTSAVNESALTGESIPADKAEGDTVSAATINQSGFIRCRATRVGEDTTLSQIIRMVSDAAATKAPIAKIADRVSGVFVPAVIVIAMITTIGWLIAGQTLAFALARGISVLVISCPCALGLATPVAIMVGNGLGAKNGVLFKTSESLEEAGKVQIVALDKTGTITSGQPEVTDVLPYERSEEELLLLADSLEQKSEHPLARAIVKEADKRSMKAEEVTGFQALPGNGLTAEWNGSVIHGGSRKFISSLVSIPEELQQKSDALANEGKTPLFFEQDGRLAGIIAVADTIKEDSAAAVKQLQNMGIEVVMLTGDNARTAQAIGRQSGVDRVIAGVLPDGKEAVIRKLQKRGKVAMVGDGINDAPALTAADTGIAIGAGTDVAIDSADIVLMNSKLTDVAAAVRLSRATLRNIHENLFWAFFYNAICIPLAAGLFSWKMNPMIGAAAMSLSSFTVCMNALRLNLFRMHDASKDRPLKHRAAAAAEEAQPEEEKGAVPLMTETAVIGGMMCEHCENRIQKALGSLDGVVSVKADHTKGTAVMQVTKLVSEAEVKKAVEEQDYQFVRLEENKEENRTMKKVLNVEGMMCEHCEATVKKALESVDGVVSAKADRNAKTAVVELSKDVDDAVLKKAVEDKDYKVTGVTAA